MIPKLKFIYDKTKVRHLGESLLPIMQYRWFNKLVTCKIFNMVLRQSRPQLTKSTGNIGVKSSSHA